MERQARRRAQRRHHLVELLRRDCDFLGRRGGEFGLRGGQLLEDGVKLQLAQQLHGGLLIDAVEVQILDRDRDRYVGIDPHQLAGQFDIGAMLPDERGQLFRAPDIAALQLLQPGQQIVDRAEFCNQGGGGFLPDARHAFDVVDRVAHQGHQIDYRAGLHAEAFAHFARSHAPVAHRVPQRDMRTGQLHEVLVRGDDDGVDLLAGRPHRQGADQVVGLVTLQYQALNPEGLDRAVDVWNLHHQVVGRRDAVGLVGFEQVVAEGLFG